jgi:hypothetical protein
MHTSTVELGPGRLRAIRSALCAVAPSLAQQHGQRQFYTLEQVASTLRGIAADWHPWIFAVFVARTDFEAWFAMRETPGSYVQLRGALAAQAVADATPWALAEDDRWDPDDPEWIDCLTDWLID